MRLFLASLTLLLLAGCRFPGSDRAASVNQPSEAAVEALLQNGEDTIADDITNDAAADTRNDTASDTANNDAADDDTPDRFTCGKDLVVQVAYGTGDGTARLIISGKTLALLAADGAPNGPYTTKDGLVPGKSLTWSANGTSATLVQTSNNAPTGSPGESVMHCTAMD
jgi:hypothetical protein